MTVDDNPKLDECARLFLEKQAPADKEFCQQEVSRFIRWYGRERPFSGMSAPEVAKYADQLSASDTDYARRLEALKAFLVFAKKAGWTKTGLSAHVKAKRGKAGPGGLRKGMPKEVTLTRQGYEELKAELAGLKQRRLEVIEEIRRAAADKDFRENAPLAAAREEKGHIEGRIMELEEIRKSVVVLDETQRTHHKVGIGGKVVLEDLASGDELTYRVVDTREVDPAKGKISMASPLGKALAGRREGDEVEVAVPAGKLHYRIKQVSG